MKRTFSAILLVLLLSSNSRAEELARNSIPREISSPLPTVMVEKQSPAWPHEGSDLRPDPKAIWGKLNNGLRYVILPSRHAAARASLRMYVRVGSLMETDSQRGIAHFLEHMAFNGSRQFPAGQTVEYLQRLGMSFAADTNASTSFDKTIYQLELPRANEELTGNGLKLFRDFLDGMTLDEKEINKERGIILSEFLARNTAGYRAASPALKFALPESLVSRRLPIGDTASIMKFSREQFVDFYETWYTPGRTTIVAVGDFDFAMVERLIREQFADAKARRGEQPDPAIGKVTAAKNIEAQLHHDADLDSTSIEFSTIEPALPVHDSIARQRDELVHAMVTLMLNDRLKKLASNEHAPFQSASFGHQRMFNFAELNNLSATCRPNQWPAAIAALEQEIRRAVQHGFTDVEFSEVKSKFISIVKILVDQAETRQPSDLATDIIDSLADNEVFVNPADAMPILNEILVDLKKEACEDAFRKIWATINLRIWMQGNLPASEVDAQKIMATYHASKQVPVAAPSDTSASTLAYTDFGPVGSIVSQEAHADLELTTAEFSNHVRINVKRTALEKNTIHVLVRFGGGLLELPTDKPGLKLLANGTFISGGLKVHSLVELNRILANKQVGIRFAVGDDAFQLGGCCSPEMLETQLQVCAAYLTAPGYRAEARQQFLEALDGLYGHQERTLEGMLDVNGPVFGFLRGGDSRFSLPPREAMHQLTFDDLQTWLAKPLGEGYLEVTLVGDVDADRAIAAAAKTLGALPFRAVEKPDFAAQRTVKFPTEPKTHRIHFASTARRSAAVVGWPTAGSRDISLSRRTSALALILNERLRVKVREELGASYTPEVLTYTSQAIPDFGYLAAVISVDPARLAELAPLVVSIGNDLANGSIGDDEFQRTMKPVLASLENRDNNYWINALKDCQERPAALTAARNRQQDWASITKTELELLAKQLLTADKATTICVAPKDE